MKPTEAAMTRSLHYVHRRTCAASSPQNGSIVVNRLPRLSSVLFACFALLWQTGALRAQEGFLSDRNRPVRISLAAGYERMDVTSGPLSQFSLPLSATVPIGRNTDLALFWSRAQVEGDSLATLAGFSDVRLEGASYIPLRRGSVVLRLAANLPSGKQNLTLDEFATASSLSWHPYDFSLPSLSQGLSVVPSASYAYTLSGGLSVGVGGGYHYRAGYRPLAALSDTYAPGGEFLVTGGFDLRLSPSGLISADARYSTYAADRLADKEIFQAGDKVVARVQYRGWKGKSEWRLGAVYRSRSRSEISVAGGELVPETTPLWPNEAAANALLRVSLSPKIDADFRTSLHRYGSTQAVPEEKLVVRSGAVLAFRLSPGLVLPVRAQVHAGGVSGFEFGAGITGTF